MGSLLSDPLVLYRKCFRYLCHADFFLRSLNILNVIFQPIEQSTECGIRWTPAELKISQICVQRAMNDFFSLRKEAFGGKGWTQAELNDINAICNEIAISLQKENQFSDDLAMTDFWNNPMDNKLPANIPPIWQVYWGHDPMIHVLLKTLKDPPLDDSSYHMVKHNLSDYIRNDFLRIFILKFLGRRINIHSMISVTNDKFLVVSSDADKKMELDGQTNPVSTDADKEMEVDGQRKEVSNTGCVIDPKKVEQAINASPASPIIEGEETTNADIEMEVDGQPKEVSNTGCLIDLKKVEQAINEVKLDTSSNEVKLDTSSNEVKLDTLSNEVKLDLTLSNEVKLDTSSNEVKLDTLRNEVNIEEALIEGQNFLSKDSHKEQRSVSKLVSKSFKGSVSSLINKFEHASGTS